MKRDIQTPLARGQYSPQAHTRLPEGTYEEEYGREGFFGPATHIYHKHPPTGWTRVEGPLRPRAFYLDTLAHDMPGDRVPFAHNSSCGMWMWSLRESMPYLWRNADGDELLFLHEGKGALMSELGRLDVGEGDYVVIPRGIAYQLRVDEPMTMLVIQATNHRYTLPDKGMMGNHAVFDPAVLGTPELEGCAATANADGEYEIRVYRGETISRVFYPFDPCDVAGWKGDTTVVRLNWRDIRPLMSHRYHVPPSAHTTFMGDGFVVCTFVPRPFESDPDALKVPFYHRNIDYDEFIFYHQGNFFSRDNIRTGMATLHPVGVHHGPHPKALAKQADNAGKMTDEVAVMVDTREALQVADMPDRCEFRDYVNSWKG